MPTNPEIPTPSFMPPSGPPSIDSHPSTTDSERVSAVERAIIDIRAEQTAYYKKFELLLLNHVEPKREPTPSDTSSALPKTRPIRPAAPSEFDGDRTKGIAFLNSCQTYIRLCPKEFSDQQAQIIWAMSYMKSGRAQKWTDRIFRWEEQPDNVGQNKFVDWEDFREEFRKEFTPAHSDAAAINRLESAAYYQKSRSLDDYVDEFRDLISDSGYSDPKTIVVKFRRGLNPQIQNAVATMAFGRPSDSDPSGWYKMAQTVDQNRAANEAFTSVCRTVSQVPRPVSTHLAGPSAIDAKPVYVRPPPTDSDRAAATLHCFRCRLPGHFGKDCPNRFDVRHLTLEELQEVMQSKMTQLDVAPEDNPHLPDVESEMKADFPSDSE